MSSIGDKIQYYFITNDFEIFLLYLSLRSQILGVVRNINVCQLYNN